MLVVVMASQKGGSGKTTLSGHLAVEAESRGAGPVALIDTDPQGSLSHWWNARVAKSPQFAKVGAGELPGALGALHDAGIRIVIIDTPPAISESIEKVIAHGDLVVVPTRPSPHDLRAVGATVDMAEQQGKPVVFVVNDATPRARITSEAAIALSQHGVVAPITIHHRVDFAASMVDGRTVGEVIPKSASAKEVGELWLYIQERLAKLKKDPVPVPEGKPDFVAAALSPMEGSQEAQPAPLQEATAAETQVGVAAADDTSVVIAADFGKERRTGLDRRAHGGRNGAVLFNGPERRNLPFGRRNSDIHGEAGPRK